MVHDSEALGTEKNINEVRRSSDGKRASSQEAFNASFWGAGFQTSQIFLWFKFLSHKVLRWFSGVLMVVLIGVLCWLDLTGAGEPIGLRGIVLFDPGEPDAGSCRAVISSAAKDALGQLFSLLLHAELRVTGRLLPGIDRPAACRVAGALSD